MLKNLKDRWNGEETKLGKFLKKWVAGFLAVCTVCASALDYAQLIPHEWIPEWLRYGIAVAAFIGWIAGKLTKKDVEQPNP